MTSIDLDITPFSRFGSYFSFATGLSDPPLGKGLYLRSNHGDRRTQRAPRELMRLDLLANGRKSKYRPVCRPDCLTLRGDRGRKVEIVFDGTDSLRLRGTKAGLRLDVVMLNGVVALPEPEGRWQVNLRTGIRAMFCPIRGRLEVSAPWAPNTCKRIVIKVFPDDTGVFELAIDEYRSTWTDARRRPFDQCRTEVATDFAGWLEKTPTAPARLRAARELAAYVNWSAVVRQEGLFARDAMLMSKRHMDNVWSWDHCFNAMALSYHSPAFAMDQFMVMFDRQDRFGALPDALNDAVMHFNYSKPPVHGWALDFMRRRNPRYFNSKRLAQVYDPLCRWSRWWLEHRTWPGDLLPHYQHGNDSGWDNSTMFDSGTPLVAPDLAAILAVQLDTLGDLAERIGKPRAAAKWRALSEKLVAELLERLWRNGEFVALRKPGDHVVRCRSLVPCMPILLGHRLPADVRAALVERIRGFMTPWGLPTEHTAGPEYDGNGYWRGPIWAPSTMIVVSGLLSVGEQKLARTIANRFCRMCAKSGFAENFDALTGAGLRDRAYTWTSSVFLILARELL